jgi:hypothetical protein
MMEDLCERCCKLKQPASLATLEYGGMSIRACLTCIGIVARVLARVPLAERVTYLRGMRERWQKSYAERERRAS